jgi:hypothetical protein
MSLRSKFIVAAAVATLGLSSPAFAQAFSSNYGTGNEQSSYYDHTGALHAGIPAQQNQFAGHRSGLNAFASVPGAAAVASDSPAATGGGSIGYNRMLREEW